MKTTLFDLIHEMSAYYWLYVVNPERDFSRERKLPFEKVLAMLVSMGGGSLRNELIDYFHCSADMASAPAFVQRRAQLLPEALEYLFHRFTEVTAKEHLYKGYHLLAADGSELQIFADPNDTDSYYPGTNGQKHYSLLHIHAVYDLLSRTYHDILIQKGQKMNENAALVQMTDRSSIPNAILIANRNYDLNIRFVRFRISEDAYETIITNLPANEFPVSEIKHLYNLRWGIETSFRELKYTIGLKQPVSKKAEYISQEIFARC